MEIFKCWFTDFPWGPFLGCLLPLLALWWWMNNRSSRLRDFSAELQNRINFLEGELDACRKTKVSASSSTEINAYKDKIKALELDLDTSKKAHLSLTNSTNTSIGDKVAAVELEWKNKLAALETDWKGKVTALEAKVSGAGADAEAVWNTKLANVEADWKAKVAALEAKISGAGADAEANWSAKYKALQVELEECKSSKIATGVAAAAVGGLGIASTSASNKKDDLKIVEGIGPKIEELFNNAGIYTFAQLASTSVQRMREILDAGGSRFQIHDPQTWADQSALARDGKWDELKKWQDELNKGKL